MTRTPIEKVTSGNYQLGRYSLIRDGRAWLVVGQFGTAAQEASLRLAKLAARALLGEATEAERVEYQIAHGGSLSPAPIRLVPSL